MIKISRFANALGIWEVEMCDPMMELKPTMKDVKDFRNILLQNTKNKAGLFDKFAAFMWVLIEKQYPEECQAKNEHGENEVKLWIEVNLNSLLEEAMVAFKWTTKDELVKTREKGLEDLKKTMSSD